MAQTSMTSFFGGGGKKRGRDDDESNAATKSKRNKHSAAANNTILLTAPGAGGSASKQAQQLFQELSTRCGMRVCRMDESNKKVSWNKFSPSHKKNMTALLTAVKRVSQTHPEKQILLCGHSFGCRVVAEAMKAHAQELRELNVVDAMICQGYPLLKSGVAETDPNNVKRAAHLRELPPSVKTLIVQGERDSFLGPRGMASLRDLLDGMEETHHFSLVEVPKCGHDLTAKAIPQVREAILEFASGLVEEDEEQQE